MIKMKKRFRITRKEDAELILFIERENGEDYIEEKYWPNERNQTLCRLYTILDLIR